VPRLLITKVELKKFLPCGSTFRVLSVNKNLDEKVARELKSGNLKTASAVYGNEDSCLLSFLEAKKLGLKCFYDLPIGYWREGNRLLEMKSDFDRIG
jgi:hypothetical protein